MRAVTAGLAFPPTITILKGIFVLERRWVMASARNSKPFSGAIRQTVRRMASPFGANVSRRDWDRRDGLKRDVSTPRPNRWVLWMGVLVDRK